LLGDPAELAGWLAAAVNVVALVLFFFSFDSLFRLGLRLFSSFLLDLSS
jgi:hypothetical protein